MSKRSGRAITIRLMKEDERNLVLLRRKYRLGLTGTIRMALIRWVDQEALVEGKDGEKPSEK